MILRIAHREFLEQLRDRRIITLGILVSLLQVVALLFGWRGHLQRQQEKQEASQTIRRQWLQQDRKDPHSAAHYGVYVFESRSPLALIDSGISSYTGESLFLEAHRQNLPRYRPAQDTASSSRFGELTAAAILRIFIPLLLVVAGFSALVGEREQGTYRLALSQGATPVRLVLGKLLGIGGGLVLLCLPGILVGGVILTLCGGPLTDTLVRGACLLFTYALYSFSALSGTLAISALSPSSRSSLLTLCFSWAFGTIIAPRLITDIAQKVYPTPSVYSFYKRVNSELSGGETGHDQSESVWKKLQEDTIQKYHVKKVEDLPFNYFGYSLQKMEEQDSIIYNKHLKNLRNTYKKQEGLINKYSILCPSIALNSLSSAISSTDLTSNITFCEESENYRNFMVKFLNNYITHKTHYRDNVKVGEEVFSQIPDFSPTREPLQQVIHRQANNLFTLAFWAVGTLVLALGLTARMHP